MKKLILIAVAIALIYGFVHENGISIPTRFSLSSQGTESNLQKAYNNRQSDLQVQGKGVVIKLLRDDLKGSRHQKFILKLSTGQTLLVSHNIDLAPRIDGLRSGDTVEFYGEYEWNSKGGVIHWTHHDPDGRHVGGWLKHNNKIYK
jgi:hypothetical protein